HLREVLIFCFNTKKSAAEAHRMLSNIYGEAAISERKCRKWFQHFKKGDFYVEDQHSGGREKVFEDAELKAFLDQDSCQNQEELARSLGVTQQAMSKRLKVMGIIQKQGNWVPYELKPRDVEQRLFACEQLLERQRRKGFLHRIVTGDEQFFIMITPSAENHGEFPAMLPHRRPNQIFTAPKCSVFGETSSA
ncbi:Mariner Mos1 transposase, partial [Acromyrmex echinatior]